jgi:N-acetylglucosamine malate deacetylase 2
MKSAFAIATQPAPVTADIATSTVATSTVATSTGETSTVGLPPAETVLVVTARPGPESTALGGLLYAYSRAGARLALLCLTRGEASPVNSTCHRLETVRPWELQLAAELLGVSSVTVADLPDGDLRSRPAAELAERVERAIARHQPDLILVVDPAAGDADDAQLARAVCLAAEPAGVPVAARSRPGASTGWDVMLGPDAGAARAVQRSAAAVHASQSAVLPAVLRGLDSLDDVEQLRWVLSRGVLPAQRADTPAGPATQALPATEALPASQAALN